MTRVIPGTILLVGLLIIVGCSKMIPKTAVIVAFGDSTTAPRRVEGQALAVYAGALQQNLIDQGVPAAVINAGIGGNTTTEARERFERDVLALDPDLVIIQFGLNDSAILVSDGTPTPQVSREEFEANLAWFVMTLRERGCQVILMTPNPGRWSQAMLEVFGRAPYDTDDPWGFNLLNAGFAESVRQVGRSHDVPVVDIYRRYEEYDAVDGQSADDLLLDGLHPNTAGQALVADMLTTAVSELDLPPAVNRGYSIPLIDLAGETDRQVIVDREEGQYLGHPTTVLLEDNRTMICVYPKGHGRGAIVMKRSEDAGLTWSDRLPTPENWATSQEVPTIYRVIDREETKRLIMFSGLYPVRMAVSADDGLNWSPLAPIGDFGGIVAMACLGQMKNGDYLTFFHDDGRFFRNEGRVRTEIPRFHVYGTRSRDGGLTWSEPEVVTSHPVAHLCEPGFIRSPDGNTIALLLRENSRRMNSFVIFSEDEGESWSDPREVPGSLTGDRHTGKYAPDGRLFISFRDRTLDSQTWGDWVGWVGTWEDIAGNREGQYRVRLMDNHQSADCAYPAVEVLPDGTFVTTTYGHWTEGGQPWIVSVRFTLAELDDKAAGLPR
ncbi:GDSL-type esterase/lipase family protein [Gemmatimonadota bacterium]